jgi:speckle-type POZ protein
MNCDWTCGLVDQATTMMKIATVGKPTELSPVITLRFEINGFAKLKEPKGELVTPLPSLAAHGHDWTINLYPRGNAIGGEGQVACYLCLIDEDLTETDAVEAAFTLKFGARAVTGRTNATFSKNQRSVGGTRSSFIDREILLNQDNKHVLPNGTLIIDVELQVQVEKRAVWYPPTPIPNDDTQKMLADLLETGRCSDVTFNVGQQYFRLHSFILEKCAPVLFRMIEEHPAQTIITLAEEDDVDPAVFQIIVSYIYTSEWPAAVTVIVDADVAKSILICADRFGCINLKHYVESVIVEKFLDEQNAADMLLLGDSHTCPQLKEAAIKIFQNQADVVMNTEGWKRVKESNALLEELLAMVTTTTKQSGARTTDDDPAGQCVAELRNQLLKRGLDVDGSRETLVKRLKAE